MEQVIECPNCGQKNRINNDNVSEAKCAKYYNNRSFACCSNCSSS